MKGGGLGYGTKTLAGGETRGGVIGNLQGEIEALRRHVLQELQDVNQKIAEGSERTSDTRRQLGETEERLGQRSDTVWEETRQQWEAVSKLLDKESKALQEQLTVQRRVEQEHRNELDAAIRAEAEARAAAANAAANALEAATLALGKRIDGVGGVEAHVNEARAAANEAIADLRQQLADEASRREELGHVVSPFSSLPPLRTSLAPSLPLNFSHSRCRLPPPPTYLLIAPARHLHRLRLPFSRCRPLSIYKLVRKLSSVTPARDLDVVVCAPISLALLTRVHWLAMAAAGAC